MKMPCETAIWHILPAIRRELTRSLVHDIGVSQRVAAQLIGMTDAAVSQYLSGKRGRFVIRDPDILEDISVIAQRVHQTGEFSPSDLCRICTHLRAKQEIVTQPTPTIHSLNPLTGQFTMVSQSEKLSDKQ